MLFPCYITLSMGAVAKYCSEYVCVCMFVWPRGYLRNHMRRLYRSYMHVAYGRNLVLLRRSCNISCTSILGSKGQRSMSHVSVSAGFCVLMSLLLCVSVCLWWCDEGVWWTGDWSHHRRSTLSSHRSWSVRQTLLGLRDPVRTSELPLRITSCWYDLRASI